VLCERAREPGASIVAINQLLHGLAEPPGPQEDARARADLLHRILEDEWLCERRGSDGRRVDGAAAQALMAMGHPYALELSPEGLDALRAAELEERSFVIYDGDASRAAHPSGQLTLRQQCGRALAIVLGLMETFLLLSSGGMGLEHLVGVVLIALTRFVPGLLAVSEEGIRKRGLHWTCLVLAALPSLAGMVITAAFIFFMKGYHKTLWLLIPLTVTLVYLAVPMCLYVRRPKSKPA